MKPVHYTNKEREKIITLYYLISCIDNNIFSLPLFTSYYYIIFVSPNWLFLNITYSTFLGPPTERLNNHLVIITFEAHIFLQSKLHSVNFRYGTESTLPQGWAVCDGKNGTPDLRDRFIIGSGIPIYSVQKYVRNSAFFNIRFRRTSWT